MSVVKKSDNTPSILAKTIFVQGDIKSLGILEIEGKTKGVIKGNIVIIREEGVVDGEIEAESVDIHGTFTGDIKANNVNFFKKAKIIGNVEYKSLTVEDGASIEGQFKQISGAVSATNVNSETLKVVR